VKNTLIKIGMV